MSMNDSDRLDWLEDNPTEAIKILNKERSTMISNHMLREHIDRAMESNGIRQSFAHKECYRQCT